jgi:hypothetical protein
MKQARNLTMSAKELDRLEIIGRVVERRLTQVKAAEQLRLSLRQVQRLCRTYRADGAAGLISRKRGQTSNHKLTSALRERAVDLLRSRYSDFGPTLACEKLTERHDVVISRETLRHWMIEAGLWVPARSDGGVSTSPGTVAQRWVSSSRSTAPSTRGLRAVAPSAHYWSTSMTQQVACRNFVSWLLSQLLTTSHRRRRTSSTTASRLPSTATRRVSSVSHLLAIREELASHSSGVLYPS